MNTVNRDELWDRDQLGKLAEQNAALRRVGTLVARRVNPPEVFAAVADEMAHCLSVENAGVIRYEADGSATIVSGRFEPAFQSRIPVGSRWSLEGDNLPAMVLRSRRAARMDTFKYAAGALAARTRELGFSCAVAVPIVVDGRMWGLAGVASARPDPLPADTEARVGDFADLIVAAIAAASVRDQLTASRERIVAAADDARRRFERDLHDGAQQRLVSLGLQLRMAEVSVPPDLQSLKEQLSAIASGLTSVSSELQRISRGIHPAILSEGGLGPALKTLVCRCPVPVNLHLAIEHRLPDSVEVAAYYVVAEALTNAAKYAHASEVKVSAKTNGTVLYLSIQDDGIGGADCRKGSGLVGLKDRVEVLGGHMHVVSFPGSGTSLHIVIDIRGDSEGGSARAGGPASTFRSRSRDAKTDHDVG